MNDSEKFVFDTAGYIVLEGVLSSEEVDEINAAIDHHIPLLNATPSAPMGGRTLGMIGDRNVHTLIAEFINEQRGLSLTAVDIMDQLQKAGFPGAARSVQFGQALSEDERLAIVAEMRASRSDEVFLAALSAMAPDGSPFTDTEKSTIVDMLDTWRVEKGLVQMGTTRTDMHGMLSWEQPYCDPFRKLLVHPNVKPYLEEICGKGYRMDHMPHVSIARKGADGQNLHGGAAQRYGQGGFLEGCKATISPAIRIILILQTSLSRRDSCLCFAHALCALTFHCCAIARPIRKWTHVCGNGCVRVCPCGRGPGRRWTCSCSRLAQEQYHDARIHERLHTLDHRGEHEKGRLCDFL